MEVKKIIIIAIMLILALSTNVQSAEPEITANSVAVIDCIDGKILYSKNMDERLYPASLTKVLTAIIVVENCDMKQEITMTQSAINNVKSGYLTSNIKPGEVFTVEELLNVLLISSCNDVANVLAENICDTEEEFIQKMNQKAREIGCTNSNFVNSCGEHDTNHYSTTRDMALIGKYAMQYDVIKEAVNKISYRLRSTDIYTKDDRLYETSNEMILSGSKNYCKYAEGIKTGFTTPAGNCLMVYTKKDDMPLVTVVMKATTSDSRYEDARKAFEYAYANNTIRKIVSQGTNLQTLSIKKATEDTKKLNAIVSKDIFAVVKDENLKTNIEPEIIINNNLKAPIEKGTIIGKVTYEIEGKKYSEELVAETEVKKSKSNIFFIVLFIIIILFFGYLRISTLYKRKKVLRKIKGKI